MIRASNAAGEAARRAPQIVADEDSPAAIWRKRLETASNLACHGPSDLVSNVSVVLPLREEPGEVEWLEALGKRLAVERELAYRTKVGLHSITITFSNRV
jgi:hypothetical protein